MKIAKHRIKLNWDGCDDNNIYRDVIAAVVKAVGWAILKVPQNGTVIVIPQSFDWSAAGAIYA
jgi:hypothetical protein